MTGIQKTLRQYLREATANAHDTLDHAMRDEAGWEKEADYARFLSLQMAARIPVEAWLETHAPADLQPPRQSDLIANDLAQLGVEPPAAAAPFALEGAHHETACLGAAWVLAGSSLGNRSILAQLQKRGGAAAQWPHAFLGDDAMLDFWKALRGRIECPVPADQQHAAGHGAQAVFDHFIAHTLTRTIPAQTPAQTPANGVADERLARAS